MPREQINFPETQEIHQRSIDGDGDGAVEQSVETYTDPAVHVNWHGAGNDRTGHVQVSLECDRSYLEKFPDEARGDRYSPVLSRSEVNKLIRILRRARDQAYGRDE
jgi:hypothetical protein